MIFPNEPFLWSFKGPYVHNTRILTHDFAPCLCRFRVWTFTQSYKNSLESTIRPRSAEPQGESPKCQMIEDHYWWTIILEKVWITHSFWWVSYSFSSDLSIPMVQDCPLGWSVMKIALLGWGMPNAALYLRYRRFRRLGDGRVQQFRGSSSISSGAIGFCGRRSTFQREGLSWVGGP